MVITSGVVPVINLVATGKNIVRLRKSAGISVRDLQDVMGFTNPQAIYKWQNGYSLPSVDNLVILAAVLGVTVDDILVLEDDDFDDEQIIHAQRGDVYIIYRRLSGYAPCGLAV